MPEITVPRRGRPPGPRGPYKTKDVEPISVPKYRSEDRPLHETHPLASAIWFNPDRYQNRIDAVPRVLISNGRLTLNARAAELFESKTIRIGRWDGKLIFVPDSVGFEFRNSKKDGKTLTLNSKKLYEKLVADGYSGKLRLERVGLQMIVYRVVKE